MASAASGDDPGLVVRLAGGRGAPAGPNEADLQEAIGLLRSRVEEEFRITERLTGKGRQLFALAAGLFAVVQTVAFGAFAQGDVGTVERVLIGLLGLAAGLALAWTAHKVADGEDLSPEGDVLPSAVVGWVNDATKPHEVMLRMIGELARVAAARSGSNVERAEQYDAIQFAARVTLILTGVELIVGVAARI